MPLPSRASRRRERVGAADPHGSPLLRCANASSSRPAVGAGHRDGDDPALQFTYWRWLSLTLAAPVVVWGALPFHRAAWTSLRHGATTMDTLISMGTLAAFLWSLYALFLGHAGCPA